MSMPTSVSATVVVTCSAPDVFGTDEFGHCEILDEEIGRCAGRQARMGADNCPEQAITIEED